MVDAIVIPWVPEIFLACGGNFRCWPKATSGEVVKTWQKPETTLEKSLAPRVCYRPSRAAIINSFNVNVLQLKKYITGEIWNTLKQKRNSKPTLIGAVDGGSGIIGSHVAKLILYTPWSLVCISDINQRCLRKKLSSQRLQRLFPILHEKGNFYSRTAIRSKQAA